MSRYDVVALAAERERHGRALANWRRGRGQTQPVLAAEIPTSVRNLRKWEQGLALPSERYRVRLAGMKFDGSPP